ncbi:nucleotide pyrophosphohydrolase [Candidatus Methanarcanum hacksteinii]|uniref:nucleotide pyrophosphohydrolase n=1 Tax=Candidatus Methanarcanum hacksteinii TaxID=2911857 RepID=UPI0037DD6116
MTNDARTINDAMELVKEFCEERDWDQFHNPKDLAIGMATESVELLELFRFRTNEQCMEMMSDPSRSEDIKDELADVFYFVLRFAQMNGIDLYEALSQKIDKNRKRYPIDKSKSSNRKYDEF